MVYITYISCSGYCPHINENVTLTGKYKFIENSKEGNIEFMLFTCPIEENSKLHYYEQCEKYKYLQPCKNKFDCPIAKKFKKRMFI